MGVILLGSAGPAPVQNDHIILVEDTVIPNYLDISGNRGVTSHSDLTNLTVDDHLHYHTDARGDARYSLLGHSHAGYEASLGNPSVSGYILSSTTGGVRSWIVPPSGGTGVTAHSALTGLTTGDDHTQYLTNARGDARYSLTAHTHSTYSLTSHTHSYEPVLGNPSVSGYVLSSTTAGVRSWIALPTGGGMVYPASGIAVSTGSSWDTSISATNLTSLSGLTYSAVAFVKMTATGTFTLDTNTYSLSSHNHDSVYYTETESDLRFAPATHAHDLDYISIITSPTSGNFPVMNVLGELGTSSYSPSSFEGAISKSVGYLKWTGAAWSFDANAYIPTISGSFTGYFPTITSTGTLLASAYQPSDFEPSISKSTGYARWTGSAWEFKNESYQILDADLTAIAALSGTAGFLKKTALNTWSLDNTIYEPDLGDPTVSGYLLASTTAGVRSWVSRNDMYTSFQTLTPSASVTWNLNNGYNAKITLDRDVALSLSNVSGGMSGCLIVTQNSSGSWDLTLPTSHKVIDGGILTISSAANAITILTFVFDGTYYYWSFGNNYLGTT
jgi:hypothetical protein